ncbi:DNA replication terminus site-binding protein [Granulosicoccus antarcticus]|uniref:DNA replication terminus site-binding protein n=1 Tax=Granulosicoccus antarcticus IMCC3135 TaxID=1192854 RepID=A0A2Z2NRB4_9GAMM|nr:DNA replication terminus site-binding protein [Granulosicoccus antarcticus]ASJ74046.1 hypothetical protein IMCC3135_19835 [Granulosicoccus antarcticus IMCC3135]
METLNRHPAIQLYQELLGQLACLVDEVRSHCDGVVVYQLPVVEAESVVPSHFPVEKSGVIDGVEPEALELACSALKRFSISAGQKRTTTYRLPGYISLSKDLSEQIAAVNELKDRLQAHVLKAYPDTVRRSRACTQIFPGVHMNQVYRHVFLIPEHITRVNFTWQCQTPADVWITPVQAVELAEIALEEESQKISKDENKRLALQMSLEYFQGLPRHKEITREELVDIDPRKIPYQLLRRNYVRPHPRVQMFDSSVGAAALFTHAANLPLIRIPSSTSLKVRDLKDYAAGKSRKRSDTKSGFEELSSALHVLGGYPSVDMYRRRLILQEKSRKRRE